MPKSTSPQEIDQTDIVPWTPQYNKNTGEGPQLWAIQRPWIDELFFGGARGGGKSDFLLGDFGMDIPQDYGKHAYGIIFRRTYSNLEELMKRAREIYPFWFPGAYATNGGKDFIFPNGAKLMFRHMQHDKDWENYQGHQYTFIGFDELPQWPTMEPYIKMKGSLRSAKGFPYPRIRSTGNPGGAGHQWIKQYFKISEYPLGQEIFEVKADEEMIEFLERINFDPNRIEQLKEQTFRRCFVKSRLDDNPALMDNDPGYALNLFTMGSETLIRAWIEGDWNIVAGAYFSEWNEEKHVIQPFTIPDHWTRIRAMDWGSAAPFCVLWFAVSDGSIQGIPEGALVCYREWYGVGQKPNGDIMPNVGLKLTAEDVGKGIAEREQQGENIVQAVCDPAAWKVDGGPSIRERMEKYEVYHSKADNTRIAGWNEVRLRLKGIDGQPMLYFFNNCINTIRTLPILQHDENRPEDVDTNTEDHAGDTVRYACMSRPWTTHTVTTQPERHLSVNTDGQQVTSGQITYNELFDMIERDKKEEDDK